MEKIKKTNIIWDKKDLLGLEELSAGEIELILKTAISFKEISERSIKKVPALRGKTIAHLFLEPSTRTRISFELAAKRLSADTIGISGSGSSILKGETMRDTAQNIEAMKVDMIILRHSASGSAHILAKNLKAGVINAGDGCHEHPTQALLDMFTIKEKLGAIKGKKVSIIGDIKHSRVARSNIIGLCKLGAEVTVCAPKTLMPIEIEKMGCKRTYSLEEAMRSADVINVLRLQKERQKKGLLPTIREYIEEYGVTLQKVEKFCKKNIVIMHPGPINRGIEMSQDVADSDKAVILEQVTNGIAIRMAVMFLLSQYKQK
ncbi:MAG: aspartate carbamoyltransferase catalytic subunit [Candidatus Omnitrophica bacterium]|nr:aspartate carbamoyltransferase catalytic subunit [Candidatus Omnitrophota bacterium]